MKWLESTGGPMVVVQAASVPEWSGYRGPDYDLACSVYDLGTVDEGSAACRLVKLVPIESTP